MRKSLGIIGGSGLYNINNLQIIKSHEITTPWGDPSNSIVELNYNDETLFFLPRHGKNHHISPSKINYRANIDALKQLGVTDILSISSVGSLKETLQPGSFVIVDQFIDLTKCRVSSFFDADIVVHVSMAHPTDKALMDIVDLSLDNIAESATVIDLVYNPIKTQLLKEAEKQGCKCIDGLGMLLYQAVPGFEQWFGVKPMVDNETRKMFLAK